MSTFNHTIEQSISKWNSRPIEDKLQRDNEALLGALKDCMYEIRDRSDIKKKALEVIKQVEVGR